VLSGSEEIYQITNPNSSSTFEWLISGGEIVSNSNNEITVTWNGIPPFEICAIETTVFGCKSGETCLPIDIVSSSNDLLQAQQIVLYPNPTSGKIYLKNTRSIDVKETTIFDSEGKLVLKTVLHEIDLVGFSKGNYYAEIETNLGVIVKRITLL